MLSFIIFIAEFMVKLVLLRVVGAGPAGPAAAGPIFGQLTRTKMLHELWWFVQLLR